MKVVSIIIICIVVNCNHMFAQDYQNLSVTEIREVLTLAINLPELQQYYHYVKDDDSRNQLIIKEYGLINPKNMKGVSKFEKEILVLSQTEINNRKVKRYLNVGDWSAVNDKLRLQLNYSAEGLTINYLFEKKNGSWNLVKSSIYEE